MFPNEQKTQSNPLSPKFEGFFLEMVMPRLEGRCSELVKNILGDDWNVKPIGDNLTEFEITLNDDALSVKEAWDKTYELRSQPGVIDVEPLFAVPLPELTSWDVSIPDLGDFFDNQIERESEDVNWCLKQLRVFEVWKKYFPDPNKLPGHGIVVAHPDTGYTNHPEIIDNLLLEKSYDFIEKDNNATDELERPFGQLINNPGHGTSTASVIVSNQGKEANYSNQKYVTGVAPGAKVLPLRVSYSVVLLSVRNLAQSIEYAADNGAHVVTISMGTAFHNQRLRSAIIYAQKRGMIIVAASGTLIPYVVFPAAYDEVIAVTGSDIRREVWWGASRGKQVDVTAPGHLVWYAKSDRKDKGVEHRIEQGSGTSFSAPFVAGVAALWLSYHGRDKLVERYGAEKIPFIFNELLRDTCDKFPTWKPNRFGSGIVNAEKLLAAPLPDNVNGSVVSPALALQQHSSLDSGRLDAFMHLFESQLSDTQPGEFASPDAFLNSNLAELLQTFSSELPNKLKEVGQELAFDFAVNPDLYKQFTELLHSNKPSPTGQSEGRKKGEPDNKKPIRETLKKKGISDILFNKLFNWG
ncbi:S8 family peptidase [Mastigocoleus testarum]|uniref:Subtilisin-like serine protease n=1 Tax=Mastigocoleus testarum BC008 TaxID=371196 RepID=A0A0V7ZQV1_9CYAN|nr:S8/S53 family peptidase [Mastigocoleus testarum]KST66843.1 subtilisin-like serine protease [Mastigocoleus testarum BC008]KST70181.1 subtilisin-like serine protease [Mastigocoleus testarum BC008]